jgi:prepilin-type N-terminal cleavage/methylation domain-containing protein
MFRLPNTKRNGFTLLEIMIVVSLLALLATVAVPNLLRGRKRSQAVQILDDLRMIKNAMGQYAIESNKKLGDPVQWVDVQKYFKTGSRLYSCNQLDILGNTFGVFSVDAHPTVSNNTHLSLLDVAPSDFWSPYSN